MCPTCQGRGTVKSVETVCYEILREIVRVHRTIDADRFLVYASQSVVDALTGDESHALAEVEILSVSRLKFRLNRYTVRNSLMSS